ncbi:hypothetical protein ACJMK2_023360, partial [Sinanodonta woodiana]
YNICGNTGHTQHKFPTNQEETGEATQVEAQEEIQEEKNEERKQQIYIAKMKIDIKAISRMGRETTTPTNNTKAPITLGKSETRNATSKIAI